MSAHLTHLTGTNICSCTHARSYHKRGIGPCWYPTKIRTGAKPETCNCREYREGTR